MPGFGAFINVRIPARFDASSGRWIPMTREVRFNRSISQEDGLLANSYSRKFQISFTEAREVVDNDVRILKESLELDGEVSLGRLGTICAGEDGTLRFSPLRSAIDMCREYGFPDVPGAEFINNTDNTGESHTDHVIGNTENHIPGNSDKNTIRELDHDRYYYIPVSKFAIRAAASVILLLVATLSVFLPYSSREIEDRASVMPVADIIDSTLRDCMSAQESELAGRHDSTRNVSSAPATLKPEVKETQTISEDKYYLIVGTFSSEREAERYVEHTESGDYSLRVVPSKRLFRVAAASASDKSTLIKDLNSDQIRNRFQGAWIWEK